MSSETHEHTLSETYENPSETYEDPSETYECRTKNYCFTSEPTQILSDQPQNAQTS